MKKNCLTILESIIKIEGLTRSDGLKARMEAFEMWKKQHLLNISIERNIIKKELTSEDFDFIIYHLGYEVGREIVENASELIRQPNKIKIEATVLK